MGKNTVEVTIGAHIDGLLSGMRDAVKAVNQSTDQITGHVKRMSSDTHGAMNSMSASISRGVGESIEKLELFEVSLNKMRTGFVLFGQAMALGWIGEKLVEMGKRAAEFGDETERSAQKTGLATDKLQELRFAAQMSDVSAASLERSMRKLSMAMIQGQVSTSLSAKAFEAVGIKAGELKNLGIEEALGRIADAFKDSTDGAAKMAVAQQLLGRTGGDLIPLLNKGSAGIKEFEARAKDLGIVIDKESIEKLAELNDQMKEVRASMDASKTQMSVSLIPAFASISSAIQEGTKSGGGLSQMFDALSTVMIFVTEVGIHLAATFELVGHSIGAGLAMAVAAAHGNFSEVRSIYKELNSDLDQIQRKELAAVAALSKVKAASTGGGKEDATGKKSLDFNPNKKAHGSGEMTAWKAELDRKHDLEQDYFKSSLADDLAFWQQKLTITKAGSKDRMAVEHELRQLHSQQAHQQLAADLEGMKAEQDAARANGVKRIQIAGEIAVKIGTAYGTESKEYKAALREMSKAAEAQQKELDKLADMQIDRAKQHALTMLDIEKERLKSEKDFQQITEEQETQGLIVLEERKYQIELDALQKKKELLREDVEAEAKAADEIAKLKDTHAAQMKKLDDKAALDAKKRWEGILQPINSAFNTSIQGMIIGTTTLHKAMANIGQSILAEFINTQVKLVSNWAAGEFAKTTATEVGTATRAGVEKTAAVTSLAVSASTNLKEIANSAWVAAANVYKSIAAIPYVGPFLAPAMAVAAGAAVIGFGKSVMSAEGGFDIPTGLNPITQLHQREMVLPQAQADVIRGMAEGGGSAQAMHFHFNGPTDKRGIEGWFKANAHALAPALRQLSRNFTPIS